VELSASGEEPLMRERFKALRSQTAEPAENGTVSERDLRDAMLKK